VSVGWITLILVVKLELNSNGKLEFYQPVAALKFVLQCEWCHFANPPLLATEYAWNCYDLTDEPGDFIHVSCHTVCIYLKWE
jgi:hypothetical protein